MTMVFGLNSLKRISWMRFSSWLKHLLRLKDTLRSAMPCERTISLATSSTPVPSSTNSPISTTLTKEHTIPFTSHLSVLVFSFIYLKLNESDGSFCIFGTPSVDAPWGWQLYGHHLCVNIFILGEEMIISPIFIGAEPNVGSLVPALSLSLILSGDVDVM